MCEGITEKNPCLVTVACESLLRVLCAGKPPALAMSSQMLRQFVAKCYHPLGRWSVLARLSGPHGDKVHGQLSMGMAALTAEAFCLARGVTSAVTCPFGRAVSADLLD